MFEFARTFAKGFASLPQNRRLVQPADRIRRLRCRLARAAAVVAVGLAALVTLGGGHAAAASAGCTAMNGTASYGHALDGTVFYQGDTITASASSDGTTDFALVDETGGFYRVSPTSAGFTYVVPDSTSHKFSLDTVGGGSGSTTVTCTTGKPSVTGISPTVGASAGGTSVTISGTAFTGVTAVTFGTSAATSFAFVSATSITAVAPAGSGTVDVTVTTDGGTSTTSSSDQFTYYDVPTVSGLSPSTGPAAGGTSVTITGTNLTGATGVKFGATAATSFSVVSATSITATAPSGSGTVDVTVTTPGGTSATSSADQYTYVAVPAVTAISPSSGPNAGGTSVTITGTNLTGATGVKFGSAAAASFSVVSATSITATSPSGSGTVDITVTTVGGTSGTSSADQFTYAGLPTVSGVSPSTGPAAGGTSVTITGTNLTGATAVKFGSAAATSFSVVSATSITATSPAGTGSAHITVTTPGGTSATSSSDQFTYAGLPTVTGVSPSSGPNAGGTSVTITGTNLTGATGVKFGSAAAASFSVVSATSITATSPAGSGTVDITVTTVGGTSATSSADQFTYAGLPTVTGLSPSSGTAAGGTSVTITGTNLTGATAVKFGSAAATSFSVVSATSITATSPAGSGTVDVTVTTPGGTTATSSATKFSYVSGTITTVASSLNPSERGQTVTFRAAVAVSSGGGTPTGTVTFRDGATTFGTGTLAGGIASLSTAALTVGTHNVTASYGGSANFAASTSAALAQTVSVPADSVKLRALQVAATKIVAQGSGQAITRAVDSAISDAFNGGGQLLSPSGTGLHFNAFADAPAADDRSDRQALAALPGTPERSAPGLAYAPSGSASARVNDTFANLDRSVVPTKAPASSSTQQPKEWMFWADVSGFGIDRWAQGATLTGNQMNALLGISRKMSPTVVVGVLGGYETFRYDSQEYSGRMKGQGWTLGSYLGWMIVPGLRFDVAAAYSGLAYDAVAGTAAGTFDGSRWLLSSGLTGTYKAGDFMVQPSAKVYALWERENAYTDSLGTYQADRTFVTGRASAGVKVAYPWLYAPGTTLAPYVGLYGDYYFSGDDAATADTSLASYPLLQGWSARGSAGLSANFANGAAVSFGGELGGIGSTTMLWTYHVRARVPF